MIKKALFLFILVGLLFPSLAQLWAADEVKVYFFYGEGCPHCAKEEVFLEKLEGEYPSVEVNAFEVWYNKSHLNLLKKVGQEMKVDVSGIPFTIIGEKTISGYLNDEVTGQKIKTEVERCLALACPDVVGEIIGNGNQGDNQEEPVNNGLPEKITLPVFGEVVLKNISLPILTMMIGALDGFNPCAMWVLLFLISLLLNMENRRRMWILGGAFILASGAVYFMFMVAWLNVLLFLGFIIWIRVSIGLVALGSGVYNLKEFWQNRNAACKVTKSEKRQRIFAKLRTITQNNKFIMALVGIMLLAVAVNLVELVCSAGFPAVYIHILTLSNLSAFSYYFYIFLYIFIFILDDLLVFVIAMITLKATGITTKYSRVSYLIGGVLMVVLGLLLLFKPAWLMFG